ncbi:MAG: capsule assembly Wzi family protein [Bacteroidia bacterium]|nr:capsule assembly Wzi family protein [Bacteroidia bacterium]
MRRGGCILLKLGCAGVLGSLVWAQDADLFTGSELYSLFERWDVRGWVDTFVPIETRPWGREEAYFLLTRTDTSRMGRLEQARYDRALFLLSDSLPARRWPRIASLILPEGRDVLRAQTSWGALYVGALLGLSVGKDTTGLLYQNTRGAYLRARLGRRIGLYADLLETQARPPFFVTDRYQVYQTLWGETFVKPFRRGGFDYLNTRGYITYTPHPSLRLKFGRDKGFWGMGFQSLFLTDYPPEYLYFHLRGRLGAWEYHSFFAQLIDYIPNKPDIWGDQPRKYLALHQLIWRPARAISLGLFEGIMYNPWTPRGHRGIELTYFIPVIFYRTAEQILGSPDNAMLGVFARANLFRRLQVYGQLAIDDYNFGKRREGRGWWGNKYAWQVGIKGFDLGLPTLDLQVELNSVQPYTYSHSVVAAAWTHHGQFMAHPYGANLRELTAILRYQPFPGLTIEARASFIQQGLNSSTTNWGSDVFTSDITHVSDFGNRLLQGERRDRTIVHGRGVYQMKRLPLYIETETFVRDGVRGLVAGMRWMLTPKTLRF